MANGYELTLSGLIRKRAELAGDIERLHKELRQMVSDLEKVDGTILLFDPSYEDRTIKPKAFRPPDDWANRGQMARAVLDILRRATEPLTSRDIALQMMKMRALNTDDAKLVRTMTKRCGVALRGRRDRGAARSQQGPGQYMVWEVRRD